MLGGILSIDQAPLFEDSITHIEYHTHNPYASTRYGINDEIRICIQHQDLFTLPAESFLYIEGKWNKKAGVTAELNVNLVNNGLPFLFEEIRYELAGVEVDRTKNVGITSTIKTFLSINAQDSKAMYNAGWVAPQSDTLDNKNEFNFCIPLRMLLGFAEDYKRIIMNTKQELILLRSSTDVNAMYSSQAEVNGTLELTKVSWKMPYIHISNTHRLSLLRLLKDDNPISLPFRTWESHIFPILLTASRQTWTVKTSSQLEKPRFVILAFQTERTNNIQKHCDEFDHCNLTNAKLFLNEKYYPYDNLNVDISKRRFGVFTICMHVFKSRITIVMIITHCYHLVNGSLKLR